MRVNTVMSEELLGRLDAFARRRHEDRSTAIRQLVDFALREMSMREAVEAYQQGRLTLRELARTLGLDVWAAHDLLASRGIAIAQGTAAETSASLAAVTRALPPARRSRQRRSRARPA
jgi:predicted HTH domain antitoxin